MNFLGRLYALLYHSRHHSLIFPLSMWIKGLPIIFFLLSLTRGLPLGLAFVWLLIAVLIYLLYWKAGRDGYVRFQADAAAVFPADLPCLPHNQAVVARATGVFSVADHEEYVLERPAEYWHVPLGDHIIMVQQRPGRFLYQFFQPRTLLEVKPGHLLFGAGPKPALAIRFNLNWGPDFSDDTRAFYVGGGEKEPPKIERWIYLSFDAETARQQVWRTATCALQEGNPI
jgi:hypothetical protein